MQDPPIVQLSHVTKVYRTTKGPVQAVRDVSIAIQPGEFFSLLGSSGSGKTTTLRLIGGFEIPEQGQVAIAGETVTTLPPYRRSVHTVFQNYALFPHLSVAQNVAYPLTIAKTPRSEIADRVAEALRMFQIAALSDRRPAQLSGGQQQRVALARALIGRPKLLLLDEPLSALDAKIREEVRQELRELQQRTQLTFIYVTHDQEEALALSDRIAVMHNGQVEQIGTPADIYGRPASAFVAQFIGKANFLMGKVVALQPLQVEIYGVKVAATAFSPVETGTTVTLMIRPEHLRLNQPAENQMMGRAIATTYIGQRSEIQLETAIGQLTAVVLSRTAGQETAIDQTTEQAIGWDAADCIVLPSELPSESTLQSE